METKKILLSLCLVFAAAFGLTVFSACSGGNEEEPQAKKHNVTVQSTEDCVLTVDKTQAEFAETVTITVELKTADKYVEKVTYNGSEATQRSDNTYDFLMGNDDVVVAVELKEYRENLTDGNGFATFLSSNTTTLAKNCGTVELTVSLRGSYMTILNWDIRSTDQTVIPGSSVNSPYGTLTETGALSAKTQTGRMDNFISALTVKVDTSRISSGHTYLLIDLKNGNTTSQRASLVVKLTVADEIVTVKWQETLLFDLSALPANLRQGKFEVQVSDFDFVAGSDNREFQLFEDVTVNDDGKAEVQIEYVEGRRYYVVFLVVSEDNSRTSYALSDTVGAGSSATGFNRLEKNMLTLLSDGQTFTITVKNETVD